MDISKSASISLRLYTSFTISESPSGYELAGTVVCVCAWVYSRIALGRLSSQSVRITSWHYKMHTQYCTTFRMWTIFCLSSFMYSELFKIKPQRLSFSNLRACLLQAPRTPNAVKFRIIAGCSTTCSATRGLLQPTCLLKTLSELQCSVNFITRRHQWTTKQKTYRSHYITIKQTICTHYTRRKCCI